MSQTYRACAAPFRPSAGHEDAHRHSSLAGQSFYVVGVGFSPGIYTEEHTARKQVDGFSRGQWKKASTYDAAVTEWNRQCRLYHNHADDALDSESELLSSSLDSPPSSFLSQLTISEASPASPPLSPSAQAPLAPATPSTPRSHRPTHDHVPRTPASSSYSRASPAHAPSAVSPRPVSVRVPLSQRYAAVETVSSSRSPGQWRDGDVLWGIEGTLALFEDRYDLIDHVYKNRLSPVRVMESQSREELEAFVAQRPYFGGSLTGRDKV
ncbi:hypothetical protein R3P38DRAFT_3173181 [Favolaschia claudopus]|uniref:Ribonuclease H1 N-terminal domain-containing protein n=1 Tax=Favolaschia claudopus TaxID=2862362 RepID=A0AAW0DBR4_9AGAR